MLSSVPTLSGEDLAPAHLWMRTYLVASGNDFEVMPGALSRVGGPDERFGLSLKPGGESKDTWVLSGGPVSEFSLLRSVDAPAQLSRGGGDLPSRVADNLFWLGRYAERTEGTARLARAIAARLSDQQGLVDPELGGELEALLRVLQERTEAKAQMPLFEPADSKSWFGWMAAAERYLRGLALRRRAERNLASHRGRCKPSRTSDTRSHFERHLANDRSGRSGDPRSRARVDARQHLERAHAAARPHRHRARSVQRASDGQHDARSSLAVPRHGPAARARSPRALARARSLCGSLQAGGSTARGDAGSRRQLDDLPHVVTWPPCKWPRSSICFSPTKPTRARSFSRSPRSPIMSTRFRASRACPPHRCKSCSSPHWPSCGSPDLTAGLRGERARCASSTGRDARPSGEDILPALSNALSEAYLSHAAVSRQLSSGAW